MDEAKRRTAAVRSAIAATLAHSRTLLERLEQSLSSDAGDVLDQQAELVELLRTPLAELRELLVYEMGWRGDVAELGDVVRSVEHMQRTQVALARVVEDLLRRRGLHASDRRALS